MLWFLHRIAVMRRVAGFSHRGKADRKSARARSGVGLVSLSLIYLLYLKWRETQGNKLLFQRKILPTGFAGVSFSPWITETSVEALSRRLSDSVPNPLSRLVRASQGESLSYCISFSGMDTRRSGFGSKYGRCA